MKASEIRGILESLMVGQHESLADTVVIGRGENGYWVADNGEEVSGLSLDDAVRIAEENLEAGGDSEK